MFLRQKKHWHIQTLDYFSVNEQMYTTRSLVNIKGVSLLKTVYVRDWARRKIEDTASSQFRAISRGNLQDLMMGGFKEHYNFKNFAPIKRSKPDLDSEATELDNRDAPGK